MVVKLLENVGFSRLVEVAVLVLLVNLTAIELNLPNARPEDTMLVLNWRVYATPSLPVSSSLPLYMYAVGCGVSSVSM